MPNARRNSSTDCRRETCFPPYCSKVSGASQKPSPAPDMLLKTAEPLSAHQQASIESTSKLRDSVGRRIMPEFALPTIGEIRSQRNRQSHKLPCRPACHRHPFMKSLHVFRTRHVFRLIEYPVPPLRIRAGCRRLNLIFLGGEPRDGIKCRVGKTESRNE
jgi:hypothetical protein